MRLFTIGFTQKSAKSFFNILRENRVERIIDIRLNNISQLAGFTKYDDLSFFLDSIANIGYLYMPILAPKAELLKKYKNKEITWNDYENEYLLTLKERNVLNIIDVKSLQNACLLCSEPTPEKCHRRLLAEYIRDNLQGIEIIHL